MYNSTGDTKYHSDLKGINAGIRPMLIATPIILIGMFLTSVAIVNSSIPSYLPYLCAVPLLLWTYYIWQTHVALSARTQGAYPIKPLAAAALALVGSPLAAALATFVVRAIDWALERLAGLAIDILPVDVPIVQSAQNLVQTYSLPLQIILCLGIILSSNYYLTQMLRRHVAEGWSRLPVSTCAGLSAGAAAQAQEFHIRARTGDRIKFALNPLGAILSLSMFIPGCVWLLKDTGFAHGMGLEQDWQAAALLSGLIAMTISFAILAKLQASIASSLPQPAVPVGDVAALPLTDGTSQHSEFDGHAA